MDQLEFKDADQWHVVNLRTIRGKIRHEKKIIKVHWNCLLGCIRVKPNGKAKVKQKWSKKGDNSWQPLSKIFK